MTMAVYEHVQLLGRNASIEQSGRIASLGIDCKSFRQWPVPLDSGYSVAGDFMQFSHSAPCSEMQPTKAHTVQRLQTTHSRIRH